MCKLPPTKIVPVRCQPKTHPCPSCGKRGRRVQRLQRQVRSLAYQQVCWLHVFYAEYQARCRCRKYFRSWPVGVPAKSDYDDRVRQAVLDRILLDGLNVQRTREALRRDFLLDVSVGFVYDCLDWQLRNLRQGRQRRHTLEAFSGILCVDELHLGDNTLLLATDPLADRIVGFLLVRANDQAHMRRFLRMLQHWGFEPQVVVTDGSNLYPAVLAEVWPQARHQLCVFHVLQDVSKKILDAVRRLRGKQSRRGNGGRKRRRGPRTQKQRAARRRRGPTNKEKAAFVFKHRFLIVKRAENRSEREQQHLEQMLLYLPELRVLVKFCQKVYELFSGDQVVRLARRRRTLLIKKGEYQAIPELEKTLEQLGGEKFDKMIAFLESPAGERVRTNNHVERANRAIRFQEKVRYKWRSRRSLDRFLCLRLGYLSSPGRTVQAPAADKPTGALTPGNIANTAGD